ncbi:neprilysin-1-like isoform X2 [Homarus americanus]|uniref:neprilysin-1-like isoform X2 n=1 Tax=Homarus americanus TaxID=6706 RepID=UPI001C451AC8|nr:neprilysin-1-like isoform X2 [Homarus americanus]
MARPIKRTGTILGVLAVVFVVIIIILCVVPRPCRDDTCKEPISGKHAGGYPGNTSSDSTTTPGTTTPTPSTTTPSTTTPTPSTTTPTPSITPSTTPSTVSEDSTSSTVSEDSTSSTLSKDSTSSTVSEDSTSSTVSGDSTSSTVSGDSTFSTVSEDSTSSTVSGDSTSSTVSGDSTFSTVSEDSTSSTVSGDFTSSTVSGDSTSSTVSEDSSEMTELPATLTSTTEMPTTLTSTTEMPTTELPATLTSTTEMPTTELLTTLTSTTEMPTTELPATLTSTTEMPTTLTSTTEMPTTELPATLTSTTEMPTTELPATLTSTTEMPTTELSTTPTSTTETPIVYLPSSPSPETDEVCHSAECKKVAGRMLDGMDKSGVKPCQDFYQYACGGVEDELFLKPYDPKVNAAKIIKDKLAGIDPTSLTYPLKKFYDSCLNYENVNESDHKNEVKKLFLDIGYTFNTPNDNFKMWNVLAKMMKLHFTPLFDIGLDLDESDPAKFVLKLTPPLFNSPFSDDLAKSRCLQEYKQHVENAKWKNGKINITDEYEKHKLCMKKGLGVETRVKMMKMAVNDLNLMENITNATVRDDYLTNALLDANNFIELSAEMLPDVPKLRMYHVQKEYEEMTLEDLDEVFTEKTIGWRELVDDLLDRTVDPGTMKVHVYFKEELVALLKIMNERWYPKDLLDIFLLLWSEKIYIDLVKPEGANFGSREYCYRATTSLMKDFTSHLYLDALPDNNIKDEIDNMVKITKQMAKSQLERRTKITAYDLWLEKLEEMTHGVPDIRVITPHLTNNKLQEDLTDDFIQNSVTLLKRYRTLMYTMYYNSAKSPEVLWNHFLLPDDVHAVTVYPLNTFLIPYGALEAPFFFDNVPLYMNYAGIGHMIAEEIAHGFDVTGIKYNGTMKNDIDPVMTSECLENQISQHYESSDLIFNYKVDKDLARDEVITNSAAIRLAWEAYLTAVTSQPLTTMEAHILDDTRTDARRRRSLNLYPGLDASSTRAKRETYSYIMPKTNTTEKQLPYLSLMPLQTYFVRYVQNHCSASSEIDMLSVMEKGQLPARLRMNIILKNEPLFAEAFNCPAASPMNPVDKCPFILG